MKKGLKNKIAIIGVVLFLVVAAIIGIYVGLNNQSVQKNSDKDVSYEFYQSEAEWLDVGDDFGTMIMDCDEESHFSSLSNATATHKKGKYVQGTGALAITSFVGGEVSNGYFKSVNISDYEQGSVHMSLYVSDPNCLSGTLYFELTSAGQCDKEELCWSIHPSLLEAGWNDLYLGIADARLTGEPNLEKINYYRMYTSGAKFGLDVIFDSVYATNTEGMSLEPRAGGITASAKDGYILDCDTLEGVTSTGTLMISTAKGEYKEGEGAIIISNPQSTWIEANLKPVDLSSYTTGKLTFWLFVNDASYVSDGTINVELSSSGTYDKNEIQWRFNGSKLKTGWNEVTLSFSAAMNSSTEPIDLTNVNYLRIFGMDCDASLLVILDGMRVVPSQTIVPSDGMILSCDTQEGVTLYTTNTLEVTSKAGEFKQGTGAFKSVGTSEVLLQAQMDDPVNISKYEGGALHLWLYINDTSKLTSKVNVELGSGGKFDVNEYQWIISGLESGWNELVLDFNSAIITNGEPDLSHINYFRVFTKCNEPITAIIDDVRAVEPVVEVSVPGVISNCDSTRGVYLPYGKVTTTAGEYKEGTGAFILKDTAQQIRTYLTLNNSVDISEYAEGQLHFWFYIDKPEEITNLLFVKFGNNNSNAFYRWKIDTNKLTSGWNEIYLDFNDYMNLVGTVDMTKISYFEIYQQDTSDKVYPVLTTIVDDIRVIKPEVEDDDTEEVTIPGMIANCDSTKKVWLAYGEVTTTEGQYKEGTGAYILKDTAQQIRTYMTLKQGVDISEYADGKLHVWFYIDAPEKVENLLFVKFGNNNSDAFYRWKINPTDLVSGWNELYLDFNDYLNVAGTVDMTNITYFELYQQNTSDNVYPTLTTIVDDIRVIKPEVEDDDTTGDDTTGDDTTDESTGITILPASAITNSSEVKQADVADGTIEYVEKTATLSGTKYRVDISESFTAVDLSEYELANLALEFWMKSNVDKTITVDNSSNYLRLGTDVFQTSWGDSSKYLDFKGNTITLAADEWTKVTLPLTDVLNDGSLTSSDEFTWLRFLMKDMGEGTVIGISDIKLVEVEVPGTEYVDFIVDVESGKEITVLQLTDTQMTNDGLEDWRCYEYIRETVAEANPDLILITGDLLYGRYSPEGESLLRLVNVMEDLGVPWAPVFGNHDGECEMGIDWICEQLENAEYCLFRQRQLTGNSNYTVGIRQDGELKRVFFMLDSNGYSDMSDATIANGHSTATVGFGADQIVWYTEAAESIKASSPNTKISFAFHIQLAAFEDAFAKYGFDSTDVVEGSSELNTPINIDTLDSADDGDFGYLGRRLKSAWDSTYTVWNGLKALGVDSIFVGHEHCNSASVVYDGIRCQYGQKTSSYDRANYLKADGSIVGSWNMNEGSPLVGGTVMNLADDGSIKEAYICYVGELKDMEYEETSTDSGMLVSGNTKQGMSISSNNILRIATAEDGVAVKEGLGAFKTVGTQSTWWNILLNNPVDISSFKNGNNGGIHLWVYVEDTSTLGNYVVIEVGSEEGFDVHEYQWAVPTSSLPSGDWYELYLPFAQASDGGNDGGPDLTDIKRVRIYSLCTGSVTAMVDDLRAILPQTETDDTEEGVGVLVSASDMTDNVQKAEVADGTINYAEKAATQNGTKYRVDITKTFTAIDLSVYQLEDLALEFWMKSNVDKTIALDNSSNYLRLGTGVYQDNWGQTNQHLDFKGNTISLTADEWTKVTLPLKDAINTGGLTSSAEFTWLRFLMMDLGEGTVIGISDIKLVEVEKIVNSKLIANCDTAQGVNLSRGEVTTIAGEYQEGTGAYIASSDSQTRIQFTLDTPVDISDYTDGADGKLHLQFYIDNPDSLYNAILIEVGNDSDNFYRWYVSADELESGWNELDLTFVSAYGVYGDTNLEEIDYVRILQPSNGTYEQTTTIVDDIRIMEWECGDDAIDYSSVTDVFELPDFIVDVESGKEIVVLQLSDTQMMHDGLEESRCYEYVRETVKATNPDLVLITGDVTYGKFDTDGSNLLELIEVMEELGVPWAPVFGNHDGECELGMDWMCEQLENAEHCLFKQRTLTGNGNYTVGIRQDGELKRVFFMLDSNGCNGISEATRKNGHSVVSTGFRQSQINWYTGLAENITRLSPNTEISFAFHIQLQAFEDAYAKYGFDSTDVGEDGKLLNNPINIDILENKTEGDFGYLLSRLDFAWDKDYTVWNGLKALGVDSIFVGHVHMNSASVVYDGIRCQYGQKSSTYDETNYLLADGSIAVARSTSTGIPLVGGTVMTLADDGSIKEAYLYYAGDMKYDETSTEAGIIISGNTKKGMTISSNNSISIATAEDDIVIKEGAGAFKSVGTSSTWWNVVLENPVDISQFKVGNNGGIHLWVYVEDTSTLGSYVVVEVGSDEGFDVHEYQWAVPTSSLPSGEWYELYLPFAQAADGGKDGGPDLTAIKRVRIYSACTGEVTAIVDDVRAILPQTETEENFATTILTAREMSADVQQAEVTDGTINYVNKTATQNGTKYRVDISYPITVEDLSAYQLEDLALEFWMKSSVAKEIAIDNSSNYLRMGTGVFGNNWGTANQHLDFTGNTISLPAGEWVKVTLPLEDAVNAGNLTSSDEFKWLRFLMMDLGEGTVISISDIKIVEVKKFETTILRAREMSADVQQAEVADGTINYVNKTATQNGTKYRVDISYPITVEDLTALKLEDLALEFWMKSSVDKEIAIDSSNNYFRMGTGVFGDNWGTANQHLDFKGNTVSLTANEWVKVTLPLVDAVNTGSLTTSAEFTWLRFLMMDLGEGTVIGISDMKLVEIAN